LGEYSRRFDEWLVIIVGALILLGCDIFFLSKFAIGVASMRVSDKVTIRGRY
jgi:hypothetical protein